MCYLWSLRILGLFCSYRLNCSSRENKQCAEEEEDDDVSRMEGAQGAKQFFRLFCRFDNDLK